MAVVEEAQCHFGGLQAAWTVACKGQRSMLSDNIFHSPREIWPIKAYRFQHVLLYRVLHFSFQTSLFSNICLCGETIAAARVYRNVLEYCWFIVLSLYLFGLTVCKLLLQYSVCFPALGFIFSRPTPTTKLSSENVTNWWHSYKRRHLKTAHSINSIYPAELARARTGSSSSIYQLWQC